MYIFHFRLNLISYSWLSYIRIHNPMECPHEYFWTKPFVACTTLYPIIYIYIYIYIYMCIYNYISTYIYNPIKSPLDPHLLLVSSFGFSDKPKSYLVDLPHPLIIINTHKYPQIMNRFNTFQQVFVVEFYFLPTHGFHPMFDAYDML